MISINNQHFFLKIIWPAKEMLYFGFIFYVEFKIWNKLFEDIIL